MSDAVLWFIVFVGGVFAVPLARYVVSVWRGDRIAALDKIVRREIEREMS